MTALMENYNVISIQYGWEPLVNTTFNYTVNIPCTVAGFLDQAYGKYVDEEIETQLIMEYQPFLK
jgi:hypothetical protein